MGLKSFFRNNLHFFLLFSIFFICELIVNPLGEFPLNDDWSYTKSVLILNDTGHYQPGDWGAMTLFTHLIWGFSYCKLFGFSFFILRLSTLISSLIGTCILFNLIYDSTNNKLIAYTGSLSLLFHPLYFNLSNTYMTDVNFTTLILVGCHFAYNFLKTKKNIWLLPFALVSIAVVLTRQYGIILPTSLFLITVLKYKTSLLSVAVTLGIIILSITVLNVYENNLKNILSENAAYKFSSNVKLFDSQFWEVVKYNTKTRYASLITQILIYTAPVLLIFMPAIITRIKIKGFALSILISAYITYNFFNEPYYNTGNVFGNMYLGAETFYETLKPDADKIRHTHSEQFAFFFKIFQFILLTIVLALLQIILIHGLFSKKLKSIINPWPLFIFVLFGLYVFMLMITESYFDRYHIPLIILCILSITWILKNYPVKLIWSIIPLFVFFYVSVFGTKDYLKINEKKWEAYHYLKAINIAPNKINGGFEINCWNDGNITWWTDFMDLKKYDYLIQHSQEKGFVPFREFQFQRYFPYKMDKISIFVKDSLDQK